jgi:hypothetical protein
MDPSINSRLGNPKNAGFLIKGRLEFTEDGRGNRMHTPGHRPWFFRLQKGNSRITVGQFSKVLSPGP